MIMQKTKSHIFSKSYFLKSKLNEKTNWLISSTWVYLLQNLLTRPARYILIPYPHRGNIDLPLLLQWISMSTVHRQCWMWKRMFTVISIQIFELQKKILKSSCKLTTKKDNSLYILWDQDSGPKSWWTLFKNAAKMV